MGWLSKNKRPAGDPQADLGAGAPPVPAALSGAAPAGAAPAAAPSAPMASPVPGTSPMGRYGPLVHVPRFDSAPEELGWQLPINGELYRLMPGSDRPDYSLVVLTRPLHFYPQQGFDLSRVGPDQRVEDRKGRTMVRVQALLVCARFVGQQLHPGMVDLPINVAYVIDTSLARDERVDFGKIEYAGVGFLSEGHVDRPRSAEASASPAAATQAPAAATEAPAATGAAPDAPAASAAESESAGDRPDVEDAPVDEPDEAGPVDAPAEASIEDASPGEQAEGMVAGVPAEAAEGDADAGPEQGADAEPTTEPAPEADAAVDVQPKADAEVAESEHGSEGEPDTDAEVTTDADAEADAGPGPEAEGLRDAEPAAPAAAPNPFAPPSPFSAPVAAGPAPTPVGPPQPPVRPQAPEPVAVSAPAAPGAPVAEAPQATQPTGTLHAPAPVVDPQALISQVLPAVVGTLRSGIIAQRGGPVHRLSATLTLDDDCRVVGLTGNADGTPPIPTPETFEVLNRELARLSGMPAGHEIRTVTFRVEGGSVSTDVTYRSEPPTA